MKLPAKLVGILAAFPILFGASKSFAATLAIAPSSISNSYAGTITLTVAGLTNNETVVIQKFLDSNTNSVIDDGDLLWQQFKLTDGQRSVFHDGATLVTNFNVPGDTDGIAAQITAKLYPGFNLLQRIVGKYLFKLSSPSGRFTPITNSFVVTNFPYAQTITGNVVNSGTNVPNAIVILFQPAEDDINPQEGVVANNSGAYSINAPVGTYLPGAFKSNYVMNLFSASSFVLNSGASITTNVFLTNATQSITGKFVDAGDPTTGLPGLLISSEAASGLISICNSDTNGNFTMRVRPEQWKLNAVSEGLNAIGYLRENSAHIDTSTGSVSGVTIALPKATAVFYGSVRDTLGNPLAGVELFASSNFGEEDDGVMTFTDGAYVASALADEEWYLEISNDGNVAYSNYVFSIGDLVTMTNGQAFHQDFKALLATNHITGHIQYDNGSPIPNLHVLADANIDGDSYHTAANADAYGYYSLKVPDGDWFVYVCCGCDDCDDCLSTAHECPDIQFVAVEANDQTADFIVQFPGGSLPSLTSPERISPDTFQFVVNGTAGQDYTIQAATNLTGNPEDWFDILFTNAPDDSFLVVDPEATNLTSRFYRVIIGPQ